VSTAGERIAAEVSSNGQAPPGEDALRGWCDPLDWTTFLADDQPGGEWTVEPILPAGCQVAIWARAKIGKSLLMLDVAAALATGRPLLGGPAIDQVDVIYIDMENPATDVRSRMLDLGYTAATDLGRLHYFHMSSLPALDTDLGGAVLAAQVDRFTVTVVIVDTTASSVAGEENSADTYRNFYRHTGRRFRSKGVGLIRLDHGGKDRNKGQRGSSAKDDDVDVVFEMTEAGDQFALRRTRSRIPWVPTEVRFTREVEPVLRHVLAPAALPEGALEVADELDDLAVALDATIRDALAALRAVERGRRQEVVAAALKYRRRSR
jgi:hypothetical protein